MRVAEAHMRLKLQRSVPRHSKVPEQVGHLHGVSFSEPGELVLPNKELLREAIPDEQIRPEDDLPEARQGVESGVRREPLVKEPPHLEPV